MGITPKPSAIDGIGDMEPNIPSYPELPELSYIVP